MRNESAIVKIFTINCTNLRISEEEYKYSKGGEREREWDFFAVPQQRVCILSGYLGLSLNTVFDV